MAVIFEIRTFFFNEYLLSCDMNRLYVCGTNAHNPADMLIYANLTNLGRHEYVPG